MGRSLFGNGRGSLTTLARFPMKVEEGRNVSPWGHPATTAFSSLNPGICGIDCVREVQGIPQVVLTRLNLAQGSCQLVGLPQVARVTGRIARVTGRTSPGAPLKNWGEERPRPARVDTPGPKLMPKYRINKTTHQQQ